MYRLSFFVWIVFRYYIFVRTIFRRLDLKLYLCLRHVIFLLLEHEEEMNLKTHRTPTYLIYDPLHTSYCEYVE